MEKRIRFTIILVLILIVVIAFSFQSKEKKEYLVYNEALDKTAVTVDDVSLTLKDIAFYVAYEEKTVQEQAILYNPDNPRQYWNVYTDGQFVKLTAKQAALDMAVHDEIFYQMAVAEGLTLDVTEQEYLENDESDFWSDLEDWQREQLGISEEELDSEMEKIALADKYQSIYAEMNQKEYEAYNFNGEAYEALLSEHEYSVNEKVWDRVEFGSVTLETSKVEKRKIMSVKIGRNDPCWCGSGRKYKACHEAFDEKIARYASQGHIVPQRNIIKNAEQIAGIKESCKINIAVLDYIEKNIHEGMNTAEIDKIVYDMTTSMGGIPAPLNYEGYPFSVCTSVNDQVCHGFPSKDVILKAGDIINVDCSTILNGYFSDSSRMFCIGEVSPEKKKLVQVTKECVELGLKEVKPWGFLGDMGQAVHDHAFSNGYTVVREIGGHGVGLEFHEEPWVGYNSRRGQEMLMVPGMIFTIEPMVNMGQPDIYVDSDNDWEVYTDDGLPSAQWEIMVLVTEDGHEVLCW